MSKVTETTKFTDGSYGYIIQRDLTFLCLQSLDFVTVDNNGVSSNPLLDQIPIATLHRYINDISCPDFAYSVDSDILTMFFKTSAYPYSGTTTYLLFGKRFALTINSLEDYVDVPDDKMELFVNLCQKGACDILGIRTPNAILDNIKRLGG